MRGRGRIAAFTLSLLSLFVACGSPDRGAGYTKAFDDAEKAETGGRFADAAHLYDDAASHARIARDREHARYMAARLLARSGDASDAAARLRAIADASPPLEDSASAAYALVELAIDRGDESAWGGLLDVARRFPSSGVARRALLRTAEHDDAAIGLQATLAKLESLVPAFDRTDLAETVAYAIARHLETLGEKEKARAAFLALATRFPYPRGVFWDDSLFRASVLDESLGRLGDAAGDLERMLDQRESSFMMGTYERPRYEPAMVRLCALYRDAMHDRARARACFDRVYRELTTSELRDDALWEEARLAREDGDTTAACDRLAALAREFPDSRYVPCATAICPEIPRAPSKAPATCHPYIERERLGAGTLAGGESGEKKKDD